MTALPVLSVSNLSKKHCSQTQRSLRYALADISRELVGAKASGAELRPGEFLAVDGVSFSLSRGESLAVIGRNGAGKSTLLKILFGLLKPDAGHVRITGRVGALIELGTGLNPRLSGRENILLGAAFHGLPRGGERQLLDEVVAFSELGEVIDAPLQTYSSGMKARLAFSLQALMRPDLLLIDEVLAVGDLDFQRKCVSWMLSYLEGGGALIFVSHTGHKVQATCRRAVLLEGGRVTFAGSAVDALHRMYSSQSPAEACRPAGPAVSGPIVIEDLVAKPAKGGTIRTGEPVTLVIRYRCDRPLDAMAAVTIWTPDRWICISSVMSLTPRRLEAGRGELVCTIEHLPLIGGRYALSASIIDPATLYPISRYGVDETRAAFEVHSAPTRITNLQIQRGQLIEIDALWE